MTTKDKKIQRFPHLAKDPLIVGKMGANSTNRLWAKVVDIVLVMLFSGIFALISRWIALASVPFLWITFEQLGRGQSPGKWLLGLHTIDTKNGRKPGFYSSLVRNLPLILLLMLLYVHVPLKFLFEALFLFCLFVEVYFVRKLKTGIRVGDVLGSTRVFDYKDEHTLFIEQLLRDEKA
jgi:uncharacterized RDD family membrane protein YckC